MSTSGRFFFFLKTVLEKETLEFQGSCDSENGRWGGGFHVCYSRCRNVGDFILETEWAPLRLVWGDFISNVMVFGGEVFGTD